MRDRKRSEFGEIKGWERFTIGNREIGELGNWEIGNLKIEDWGSRKFENTLDIP